MNQAVTKNVGHTTRSVERKWIFGLATTLLFIWITACFSDINYPAQARLIRVLCAAGMVAFGILEIRIPWAGFKLFFLFWPQGLLIRELLTKHVSQLFGSAPVSWGGPLAAVLTLSFLWRLRGAEENPTKPIVIGWGKAIHYSLWSLTGLWILSSALATFRLHNPAASWHVGNGWRLFLTPGASVWTPLQSCVATIPPILLGLALTNCLPLEGEKTEVQVSASLFKYACIGLVAAAFVLLLCHFDNFSFSFDDCPPSGPFSHRNTAGPICIIAAVMAVLLAESAPEQRSRLGWLLLSVISLFAAYESLSRNAYVLAIFALLAAVYRPTWKRVLPITAVVLVFVAIFYWLPLSQLSGLQSTMAGSRLYSSIVEFREGKLNDLSANRLGLWLAAWKIFTDFPLLGSGPNSFAMLAYPGSQYEGHLKINEHMAAAHSMPLNILAECGMFAAISWCLIWLVAPSVQALRMRATPWAFICLLIGISNILDTTWMIPGMTTFACCTTAFGIIEWRGANHHR